jgi:hypothetical protein
MKAQTKLTRKMGKESGEECGARGLLQIKAYIRTEHTLTEPLGGLKTPLDNKLGWHDGGNTSI